MIRALVLSSTALLTCAFAWPPDYVEQSRADVTTCVEYTRRTSPTFTAAVRSVDLETGLVDIERSGSDARSEAAFSRCLLAVRHWRIIERNLPNPAEPELPDPTTMAGRPPDFVTR